VESPVNAVRTCIIADRKKRDSKMKITPTTIFGGLALLLVVVATIIWLAFDVFHIFNIANIVSGNPN
jgi:hypothetical protein